MRVPPQADPSAPETQKDNEKEHPWSASLFEIEWPLVLELLNILAIAIMYPRDVRNAQYFCHYHCESK